MDGSSKDAGYFTIKFDPEEITYAKGDGAVVQDGVNTKQKAWLCSNFRVRVGKLPCARVASVDAFTIKQGTGKEGTGIEFPNLKIRFSAADAAAWQDWFNEFVVQGRNGQDKELDGAIEFLDPALKEVLGSVELSQIGIFSLGPEKQEAGSERDRTLQRRALRGAHDPRHQGRGRLSDTSLKSQVSSLMSHWSLSLKPACLQPSDLRLEP